MFMSSRQKRAVGSLLAIIGAFGIVAGPMLGWSSFERPWSFVLGFVFGVSGGAGAAIGIHGLINRRSGA
jgi:hypothetical protein